MIKYRQPWRLPIFLMKNTFHAGRLKYMKKEQETIVISNKHLPLRIALFVAALALAIFAFSKAITNLGIHEEGYYTIQAASDKEAANYTSGIELSYHIKGESVGEMRELYRGVTNEYTSILARAYKLLDNTASYEGYNNLAYIYQHQGEKIVLSEELFDILDDAYKKTLEQRGFNMFAGALYKEWSDVVYSYDHEEIDPSVNEEEASRIAKIAALVNDLSNFELVLDKAETPVIFNVSGEYEEAAEQLGIEVPALDLNLMKYAYMMEMIRAHFEAAGLTDGILTSDNGLLSGQYSLVINMEDVAMKYPVYDRRDGVVYKFQDANMDGKFSLAAFHAFPMTEADLSSYVIKDEEGKEHLRNMYFDVQTGFHTEMIDMDYCFALSSCITDAAYANLCINTAKTEDEYMSYTHFDHSMKRITATEFD